MPRPAAWIPETGDPRRSARRCATAAPHHTGTSASHGNPELAAAPHRTSSGRVAVESPVKASADSDTPVENPIAKQTGVELTSERVQTPKPGQRRRDSHAHAALPAAARLILPAASTCGTHCPRSHSTPPLPSPPLFPVARPEGDRVACSSSACPAYSLHEQPAGKEKEGGNGHGEANAAAGVSGLAGRSAGAARRTASSFRESRARRPTRRRWAVESAGSP